MTSEDFRCFTPIKIRFRDLDAFGHVNNAVYFSFMEMARVEYFTRLGLAKLGEWPTPFFIIAEAACQFKAPIQLETPLIIQVRVSRFGNSSFDMEYRFVDESTGVLLATGRTVQVVFDYAAGRSVPMPADWRATMLNFEGA